ncbi:MAG: N-acetylmuramoyl-L-alanine amidase family protein [Limisphaerales bacterium]
MKSISILFRIFVAAILVGGAPFSRAAFINGQNYVSFTGWARANGLRVAKESRDEIILTGKTSRLIFNVDSAESEINGVDVRLSFPVAKGALISQLDLDTAVRPLIYSQKPSAKKITTICLDPGHGGKDTGNRVHSLFWHNEKTYTLLLAFDVREDLEKAGFKVILTRSRDVYVDLPERPAIANRDGADLFISLHFNATQVDKNEVHGPETYCITPVGAASSNSQGEGADHEATVANRVEDKSLLLAYQIQKSLVQNLHVEDRDVRRARFAVLRDARMPAILIEGGYMTNPTEGKKIFSAAYRRKMAAAITKGILAYQKLTEPKPVISPSTTAKNKVSTMKQAR